MFVSFIFKFCNTYSEMDNQKYKQWLIKLSNIKIEKPAEIAKIRGLSAPIQQLSIQINSLIKRSEQTIKNSEDRVNNKTSQLFNIERKHKDNWHTIQKQIQNIKQKNYQAHKTNIKKMQQVQNAVIKKSKTLQTQLSKNNKKYEQLLSSQLDSIKKLKIKASQQKQLKKLQFQSWIKSSLKKADKILASQEQDLLLIDQYQKQILARCENVSEQYLSRLQQIHQESERKQKILYGKIQVLISDIDVA